MVCFSLKDCLFLSLFVATLFLLRARIVLFVSRQWQFFLFFAVFIVIEEVKCHQELPRLPCNLQQHLFALAWLAHKHAPTLSNV